MFYQWTTAAFYNHKELQWLDELKHVPCLSTARWVGKIK